MLAAMLEELMDFQVNMSQICEVHREERMLRVPFTSSNLQKSEPRIRPVLKLRPGIPKKCLTPGVPGPCWAWQLRH